MATLYELTGIYRQIYEMTDDEETRVDTLESIDWNDSFVEKAENYVKVIKNKEADLLGVKAEIDRLTKVKVSLENNIDRLKTSLQGAMEITGNDRVKTGLFNLTVAKNRQSVVVDEDKLPKKYFVKKVTVSPDKKGLYELLRAGKKIKGAALQESRSLRIR